MLSQTIKIENEREKSTPDIGRLIDNFDKYSEILRSENINAKILEVDKIKYYFTDFDSCDIEFSANDNKGYAFESEINI